MAKSLRSKRRRKIRAEKRIVNAKKELAKLKEIAARLHGSAQPDNNGNQTITRECVESNIPHVRLAECPMQLDEACRQPGAKRSVMRVNNQWMNQRRIKAIKSKIKRHNEKKARRVRSAGLSSRKAKKGLKK